MLIPPATSFAAETAGAFVRQELLPHMEVQVAAVEVHAELGTGGFGKVVSATLTLDTGATWRTAIKLMPYHLDAFTLNNIRAEVVIANTLGEHPGIVACVHWLILGDGSNTLPRDALDIHLETPCGAHEIIIVLALSQEMDKDYWSFLTAALHSPFPSECILVSGLGGSVDHKAKRTGDKAPLVQSRPIA